MGEEAALSQHRKARGTFEQLAFWFSKFAGLAKCGGQRQKSELELAQQAMREDRVQTVYKGAWLLKGGAAKETVVVIAAEVQRRVMWMSQHILPEADTQCQSKERRFG